MFSFKTFARAATVAAGALFAVSAAHAGDTISGAGATFPYPVYSKWAEAYKDKTDIGMNYQAIGSGGGIKQINAKTVDFGASDKPLKPETLKKDGLMQFPMVMGGIVPVVNLKGIKPGEMKIDGKTLADIYLGKVTKWNDPEIAALNKGVSLPDQDIAVVHRSDGSGTTFNFTYYLNDVSPAWSKVGVDASVEWPTGIGGKGNAGVAALVGQTDGSIGYVEYAYALQNHLTYTNMVNKDGKVVAPKYETFQAAASNADWEHAAGYYLILANQPGADSWPMTAATFILMHTTQAHPQKAKEVLNFFNWAYANGDKMAKDLDYIPMPDNVVKLVKKSWMDIKDESGKPVLN